MNQFAARSVEVPGGLVVERHPSVVDAVAGYRVENPTPETREVGADE